VGKNGLVCAVRERMYKEWGKGAMSSHPANTRLSAISTTVIAVCQCSSSEADMLQLTEPEVTALFTRVSHRTVTCPKAIQSKFSYSISSRPILKPAVHLPLDLSSGPSSFRSSQQTCFFGQARDTV